MLTIDEKTIIKMYSGFSPDRDKTIAALKESLEHIEEPVIQETVSTTIRKITSMSKETFAAIDFTDTLDDTLGQIE